MSAKVYAGHLTAAGAAGAITFFSLRRFVLGREGIVRGPLVYENGEEAYRARASGHEATVATRRACGSNRRLLGEDHEEQPGKDRHGDCRFRTVR